MRYFLIILLTILYLYLPAQQSTFLRATTAATSGGGSTTGILDSYTGAEAAYATALLYSSYGGSCLRVRRDSDNAEQDIGFSGQDIDEAAINTFCSGANCFVKTWYDQTGNGHNATQATTTKQPKIYDSSTGIVYENSITALEFNGGQQLASTFSVTGEMSAFFVRLATTNGGFLDGYPTWGIGIRTLSTISMDCNSSFLDGLLRPAYSFVRNQQNLIWFRQGVSNANLAINGTAGNSQITNGTPSITGLSIGSSPGPIYGYMIGTGQAVIFYDSDQSANRTGIETAINNYYNIYP